MKKIILIIVILITQNIMGNIDELRKQYEHLQGTERIETIISLLRTLYEDNENLFLISEELYDLSETYNSRHGLGIALSNFGYKDYLDQKYDASLEKYDRAKELLLYSKYKIELSQLYNRYGYLYHKLNKTRDALDNIKSSIDLSESIGDTLGLCYSYNNAGLVYWAIGVYDSAIYNYEKSLIHRKKINNKLLIARTTNNLAVIYYNIGRLETALDYYYDALALHEEIENYYGMSLVYCNIGLIQRDRREFNNAKRSFHNGLIAGYKSNRNDAIGYAYNSIASIHKVEGQFDSSMYYYHKSIEYYEKIQDYGGIAFNLTSIGELYQSQRKFDTAEEYLNKALEHVIPRNEMSRISQIKLRLGEIRKEQKRFQEAIEFFNESIDICIAINKKDFLMANYLNLAQVFEELKLPDSALYYYKNYKEISDQIFNEAANKKILELEYRYNAALSRKQLEEKELELNKQKLYANILLLAIIPVVLLAIFLFVLNNSRKKANVVLKEKNDQIEKQRLLLEKQAEELSKSNEELKESNAVKDTFFSIIAHDLRSPFNAFLGLTSVLNDESEDLTKEEQKIFLTNLHKSARNLYKLLDNLLTWSSVQRGVINNNPQEHNINDLIEENISVMKNYSDRKEITIHFSRGTDSKVYVDHDILSTIIRNLLSNAIKFTYRNGFVEIGTRAVEGNQIEFFVKDNGIGMPTEILDNIFSLTNKVSTPGTENEQSTGLGLILCNEFVEKIGGSIRVESELGKGSTFYITIPGVVK